MATSLIETIQQQLEVDDVRLLWRMLKSGYRTAYVPCRSGKARKLSIPSRPLRRVQDVLAKQLVSTLSIHSAAHGFVHGRSTLTAAQVHVAPSIVINLDLADWYNHVTQRLRAILARSFVDKDVAFIMHACTVKGPARSGPALALPQGAPTSPVLANAAAWPLDERLAHLAVALRDGQVWRYTRFADDITFSCSAKRSRSEVQWLLERVERAVHVEGHELVDAKLCLARPHQSQQVQGLVVNTHDSKAVVRLPRVFHRKIRAALFNRNQTREARAWSDEQIRGAIALVQMVEPARATSYLEKLYTKPRSAALNEA